MIRLLVALLLVANVLLFLYGYLGVERSATPQEPVRPPDVGSLRLLSARVIEPQAETGLPAEPEPSSKPEPPAPAESEAPQAAEVAANAEPDTQPEPPVEPAPEPKEPSAGEPQQPSAEPVDKAESSAGLESDQAAAAQTPVAAETEQASAAEPPATEPPEEKPVKTPERWCGAVGPFRSARQARAWLDSLSTQNGARLEQRPTWVEKSYWVYLPPQPTRAKAVALEQKLKAAGVTDLWRLRKGEMRNAISLGLYTRKDAAEKRLRNLQAKGFDARLKTTREQLPRYWIRFDAWSGGRADLESRVRPDGMALQDEQCD